MIETSGLTPVHYGYFGFAVEICSFLGWYEEIIRPQRWKAGLRDKLIRLFINPKDELLIIDDCKFMFNRLIANQIRNFATNQGRVKIILPKGQLDSLLDTNMDIFKDPLIDFYFIDFSNVKNHFSVIGDSFFIEKIHGEEDERPGIATLGYHGMAKKYREQFYDYLKISEKVAKHV